MSIFAKSDGLYRPRQIPAASPCRPRQALTPAFVEGYGDGQCEISDRAADVVRRGDVRAISLKVDGNGVETLAIEFRWLAQNAGGAKAKNGVWVKDAGGLTHSFDFEAAAARVTCVDAYQMFEVGQGTARCAIISSFMKNVIVTLYPKGYQGNLRQEDVRESLVAVP